MGNQEKTIEEEKEFSPEFQKGLLDLAEICVKAHTDGCTLTFDYEDAVLETELTFNVRRK